MSLNTFRFSSVAELVLTWYKAVFLHVGRGGSRKQRGGDQKGKEVVASFSKYPGEFGDPGKTQLWWLLD